LAAGNVMLEETYERHVVGDSFADEKHGLYVIRGENLVLLGEIDVEKDLAQKSLKQVSLDEIKAKKAALKQERAHDDEIRKKLAQQALGLGFDDCL